MRNAILTAIALGVLVPAGSFAAIGVGVGVGKIIFEEPLELGRIHDLTSIPVLNTGDEPSDYEMLVEHANNPFLKPKREWFQFEPREFYLEPGEVQVVKIRMTLPLGDAKPGDYFAYLQAKPVYKSESGSATRIGIAAAVKLSFTTVPSNFWQALRYRAGDLFELYKPWTIIVPVLFALALLFAILKRFVHLNLQVGMRPQGKKRPAKRRVSPGSRSKKSVKKAGNENRR